MEGAVAVPGGFQKVGDKAFIQCDLFEEIGGESIPDPNQNQILP